MSSSTRSNERALGDRWAAKLRRAGCWVQKLPASALSGLPDWLVGRPAAYDGMPALRFVEAKRRHAKRVAYVPEQLTRAQWYMLDQLDRFGGRASVLVLDDDGYVELDINSARFRLDEAEFEAAKQEY